MKLLILDYIRGLWESLGERIIAILWPHIVDERLKIKSKVDSLAETLEQLSKTYDEDIEEYDKEYTCLADRFGKLYLAYEKLQKQVKKQAKAKPKDPNKVSKPIKPRVGKAK